LSAAFAFDCHFAILLLRHPLPPLTPPCHCRTDATMPLPIAATPPLARRRHAAAAPPFFRAAGAAPAAPSDAMPCDARGARERCRYRCAPAMPPLFTPCQRFAMPHAFRLRRDAAADAFDAMPPCLLPTMPLCRCHYAARLRMRERCHCHYYAAAYAADYCHACAIFHPRQHFS